MSDAAKSAVKQRGRPFKKDQSGNPSGRPQGSRNKATLAVENLLDGEAEKLTRKAVEMALAGDTTALRLCLERLSPPHRDRPIKLALPGFSNCGEAVQAQAEVIRAVADGSLTPSEGRVLTDMLEAQRRAFEAEDLERRIAALEYKADGKR